MEKKILCYGREVEYEGRKFWTYKVETKDGYLMNCSFKQSVNIAPPKSGTFYIILDSDAANNVSYAKRYPVLWVSNVIRYEDYTSQRNTRLEDYFD